MCARLGHARQVGACAPCWGMCAMLGHVRLVGACAPVGGMCARWGNVRQVGQYAPRGYMCTRWWHVRKVGGGGAGVPGRGEVGVHENILILVRSMYLSEYI